MQPETPVSPSSAEAPSEDCLVVDIYTPAADGRARPVLFWIHGGGFYIGSGNDHDGSVLAAQGDVVVVTVNYRLGVFVFSTCRSTTTPWPDPRPTLSATRSWR